jgi:hypothetical protein
MRDEQIKGMGGDFGGSQGDFRCPVEECCLANRAHELMGQLQVAWTKRVCEMWMKLVGVRWRTGCDITGVMLPGHRVKILGIIRASVSLT